MMRRGATRRVACLPKSLAETLTRANTFGLMAPPVAAAFAGMPRGPWVGVGPLHRSLVRLSPSVGGAAPPPPGVPVWHDPKTWTGLDAAGIQALLKDHLLDPTKEPSYEMLAYGVALRDFNSALLQLQLGTLVRELPQELRYFSNDSKPSGTVTVKLPSAQSLCDPREEGLEAFFSMIRKNLALPRTINERPWICVNTGTKSSGKTIMLKLTVKAFLEKYPRSVAVYITFNGKNVAEQAEDETEKPPVRVYNRILFALRKNQAMTFTDFMKARHDKQSSAVEVAAAICERFGTNTDVLIAADELSVLGPINGCMHGAVAGCQAGLSALNQLVREAHDNTKGRVFVVASAYAAVDVKQFQTGSSTPFTLQPLLPIGNLQLRAVLSILDIPPNRRRMDEELDLVRKLVQLSLNPQVLTAVEGKLTKDEARAALKQQLPTDFLSVADTFIKAVLVPRGDGVAYGVELLQRLFRSSMIGQRHSFQPQLHAALDAMCYDACRVIRREQVDTVMMHPTAILAVCDYLRKQQLSNTDRELVEATHAFAEQLATVVAVPSEQDRAGKDFETLMMRLLRCVLLTGKGVTARSLFAEVGAGFEDFALPTLSSVREVTDVCAFPRAYEPTGRTGRSVECDAGITAKLPAPCVCAPTDRFNLLLDFVVVVPRGAGKKNVCWAVQCKEDAEDTVKHPGFAKPISTWRNREAHLAYKGTAKEISAFRQDNEFLWVLAMPTKPAQDPSGKPFLQPGEALLTLEHAKQWCPSLAFAETAMAVSAFLDESTSLDTKGRD